MPALAVECTLPAGSASQRWRLPTLPGRNASVGQRPSGNRGPSRVEEKLSGRLETCQGQSTEARGPRGAFRGLPCCPRCTSDEQIHPARDKMEQSGRLTADAQQFGTGPALVRERNDRLSRCNVINRIIRY